MCGRLLFIRTSTQNRAASTVGSEARYIIPDIIVEKVGDDYVVMNNDSGIPQLTISPFYRKLMQSGGKDEQLSTYIKGKLEKAYWLIRSIEQRRLTLYKVSQKIVEIQRSFLEHGIKQLKPLTLKEVARQRRPRIDGQPFHEQQVYPDAAGHFPLKVLFLQRPPQR